MRVSRAEKERSRERIVASAARRLRERGVEGCGVAEVMSDAGLTHGGFYRHFQTKEAMVAAALDRAFEEILATIDAAPTPPAAEADRAPLAGFVERYLSEAHVANPGRGCPIPALSGEAARAGEAVRDRFGEGVRRIVSAIANQLTGTRAEREKRALRRLAMMAGAVAIARACDPQTAAAVLAAVRDAQP